MIRCPELEAFGVIDIVLLNVPVWVNAGDAGTTTVGSKSIFRSYEITLRPVRSPTVIGIAKTPGVATTFGKDTVTVVPKVTASLAFVAIEGASISLHDAALPTGTNFAIAKTAQQKNT